MTNTEILTKAIKKAEENGVTLSSLRQLGLKVDTVFDKNHYPVHSYQVIFNHDFAKALWGEEDVQFTVDSFGSGEITWLPAWQYHLQQMVIAKNPLDYLRDNI